MGGINKWSAMAFNFERLKEIAKPQSEADLAFAKYRKENGKRLVEEVVAWLENQRAERLKAETGSRE